MENQIAKIQTAKELSALSPGNMLSNEFVANRFIQLFDKVHGSKNGEMIFERERFHVSKILAENPKIAECTTLSIFGAFLDTAIDGLSLDPSLKLTYLIPQSVNVGTSQNPVWEKRCVRHIAPQGELILRQRAKQIKNADNVVIVYEGDTFEPNIDSSGNKSVIYKALVPNTSNKIIAAFIKLTRPDGTTDFFWMMERDIARLKDYSDRKNSNSNFKNPLYTNSNGGIDSGFLAAKVLKHAFKSFPKVTPQGQFSKIEPEEIPTEIVNHENIYGFNPNEQHKIEVHKQEEQQPENENLSDEARVAMKAANTPKDDSILNFNDPSGIF